MATPTIGLQLWAGATQAATSATVRIGEIIDITVPGWSRADIDVSSFDGNGVRQFMPGFIEIGEAEFTINWNPSDATDDLLRTMRGHAYAAASDYFFEVRYTQSGAAITSFRAYMKGFQPGTPMEEEMSATVTLRPVTVPVDTGF